MISFAMDYHWKSQSISTASSISNVDLKEKERIQTHLPDDEYSLLNYVAYILYAPLYMAGPIITYNNFIRQMRHTPISITRKGIIQYLFRLLVSLATMEVIMHLFWVVAIKDTKAWKGFTPIQIYSVGYLNLKLIWLKVLVL